MSVEDVLAVQEEYGGKIVHVKLREGEKTEEKIREILKNPSLKFIDSAGQKQDVYVSKNGAPLSFVKVRNLPPEAGMTALKDHLSEYGVCLKLEWGRFKSGPFVGILNGMRLVTIALSEDVPSYIEVLGHEAVVEYAGQPRTCRICDSQEHLRARCPQRYATGTEEAADAASLADSDPAGGEEGEEEEMPVQRAASEPPPTTTSADVAEPEPAADVSPRGNECQHLQQDPAAGEQTTAGGEAKALEGADGKQEVFGKNLIDFAKVLKEASEKKRGASNSPEGGGVQTRRQKQKKSKR